MEICGVSGQRWQGKWGSEWAIFMLHICETVSNNSNNKSNSEAENKDHFLTRKEITSKENYVKSYQLKGLCFSVSLTQVLHEETASIYRLVLLV